MKKKPSKRRILARLLQGKSVAPFDIVRHRLEGRLHLLLDEYKLKVRVTDLNTGEVIHD